MGMDFYQISVLCIYKGKFISKAQFWRFICFFLSKHVPDPSVFEIYLTTNPLSISLMWLKQIKLPAAVTSPDQYRN